MSQQVPVEEMNQALAEIAAQVYGERATLQVVDPKSLRLLKKNARYFKKSVFDQLVANVAQDGMLSSVPLCHRLEDGSLEVVSGNHRVQAAVKANLDRILVIVIPKTLDGGDLVARQLSHNALVGQDDKQILAELWRDIGDLEHRLYSGLDSELIAELEKIAFSGFTPEQIRTEQISLWFLPEEVEHIDALIARCQEVVSTGPVYMAPLSRFEKLFNALVAVKKAQNLKNTAVALMLLIDRLEDAAAELVAEAKAEAEQQEAVTADE
jgi:hypothetical protein